LQVNAVKSIFKGINKIKDVILESLIGLMPNIFGIRDWLANKLGVDVTSAKEKTAARVEKVLEIQHAIREAIIAHLPRTFGIQNWVADKWGVDVAAAKEKTLERTEALNIFMKKLRFSALEKILKLIPQAFGLRKKVANRLGIPIATEPEITPKEVVNTKPEITPKKVINTKPDATLGIAFNRALSNLPQSKTPVNVPISNTTRAVSNSTTNNQIVHIAEHAIDQQISGYGTTGAVL